MNHACSPIIILLFWGVSLIATVFFVTKESQDLHSPFAVDTFETKQLQVRPSDDVGDSSKICEAWGIIFSKLTGKKTLSPQQCSVIIHAAKAKAVVPPDIFEANLQQSPESIVLDLISPVVGTMNYPYYIDVGTNVGQLAIQALQQFSSLHAVMMEPIPETCLTLFTRIKAANVADRSILSCSPATASYSNMLTESNSISTSSRVVELKGHTNEGAAVHGIPVDSLISPSMEIALFKTDTQGFECSVLEGAHELLDSRRAAVVIVEVSYSMLKSRGCSVVALLDKIYSSGYLCTVLAFFGRVAAANRHQGFKFEKLPRPQWNGVPRSIEDLSKDLEHLSPFERYPGWTDVMCIPS